MSKRYSASDPTANAAVKAADRSAGVPRDRALRFAAEARARGDEAGYDRAMAAARRADGEQ